VGFSYSETPSDYVTRDYQTAQDSVVFLQQFILMYPQFTNSMFWISGESYGGHYVPNLAKAVLQANAAGGTPKINLAGFQVGNAWTVAELDNEGAVDMWYSHSIISQATYNGFYANCNFSGIGPLADAPGAPEYNNVLCDEFQFQADKDMYDINIYQVYYDVCLNSTLYNQATTLMKSIAEANPNGPYPAKTSQVGIKSKAGRLGDQEPDMDPCVDNHMTEYLNIPAVQTAIHANPTVWSDCNNPVQYSRTDLLTSMIPVYQWLLTNSNIRMLVYSGDIDGIVPTTGTKLWIAYMNMTITDTWHPWIDSQMQTGGWTESYKWGTNPHGLVFASVRDAGHMVPWCQPGRSFDLFSRFLIGKRI
jgi:serine carboxypeptidase-like clade 2